MDDATTDVLYQRQQLAAHMHDALEDMSSQQLCKLDGSIEKIQRIGTKSVYGQVFLVSERAHPQHFAAAKVMYATKDNQKEIAWYKYFERWVTDGKSPHFPLVYFHKLCGKTCAFDESAMADKKQKNKKKDDIAPPHGRKHTDKCIVVLSELAKGDLRTWIQNGKHKVPDFLSMMGQLFMALWVLMQEDVVHNDLHWGNLLYHETPQLKGKWMTYHMGDSKIQIRNQGVLWVLWDFGKMRRVASSPLEVIHTDAYRILHFSRWATGEKWKVPSKVGRLCEHLVTAIKKMTIKDTTLASIIHGIPDDIWSDIERVIRVQLPSEMKL